jgi:hypothetical protein
LRFKTRSPGTALLVQQLQDFPWGDHDDGPDALEQALRLMIELWNGRHQTALAPTAHQLERVVRKIAAGSVGDAARHGHSGAGSSTVVCRWSVALAVFRWK